VIFLKIIFSRFVQNSIKNQVIYLQQLTLTEIIAKVDVLIDTGNRYVERLQHIYGLIVNEKPLYHPDQVYLETKLQPPIQNTNSISAESSKTK